MGRSERRERLLVKLLLSADGGRTFEPGGAIPVPQSVREFDEYNVVQLRDGRLWLLNRTKRGPHEAFSSDGGQTWTDATPHPTVKHTVSRHFLARLASGRILLVKHGAIEEAIGRTRLTAFLSDDDGDTWRGGLVLDERRCSYPDGCQGPDGTIYVIYDHERTRACEILMARITEDDILAGKLVSPNAALKRVVNDDGVSLRPRPQGALACERGETARFEAGALLFRDREYVPRRGRRPWTTRSSSASRWTGQNACVAPDPAWSISSRLYPTAIRTARRRP